MSVTVQAYDIHHVEEMRTQSSKQMIALDMGTFRRDGVQTRHSDPEREIVGPAPPAASCSSFRLGL